MNDKYFGPITFALLISLLLFSSWSCTSDSIELFPDGDEDSELDLIVLKGSSEGGNARDVRVRFAPYFFENKLNWSEITLGIDYAYLPFAPTCKGTAGQKLTADAGSFSISVIGESAELKLLIPDERDYCSIDFLLQDGAESFHAEGKDASERRIIIDTDLQGILSFKANGEVFHFEKTDYHWIAALNLDTILPPALLSDLELDEEGVIRVDKSHNAGQLEALNEAIVSSFSLRDDSNDNGRVDPSEIANEETLVGVGNPKAVDCGPADPNCASDGDRVEPPDGDEDDPNDGDISTDGDDNLDGDMDIPPDGDELPACGDRDCGPAPGMPNWECWDGSIGGPDCQRLADGGCAWIIVECPPEEECNCTEQYDPVCGVDGISYDNDCFAGCAGVTIAYLGACFASEDCQLQDEDGRCVCGGFVGYSCPEGMDCFYNDPNCDPANGGADCMGICIP